MIVGVDEEKLEQVKIILESIDQKKSNFERYMNPVILNR
jgi:hypothetical protein